MAVATGMNEDAFSGQRILEASDVLDAAVLEDDRVFDARSPNLNTITDGGDRACPSVDYLSLPADDDRVAKGIAATNALFHAAKS